MEVDDTLNNRVLVDQVSRFVSQSIVGICATLFISSILTVVLWGRVSQLWLILWCSTTIIAGLARLLIHIQYLGKPLVIEKAYLIKKILLWSLGVSGCLWGLIPVFTFSSLSIEYQVFIIFIIGGMIAGSVSVFASIRGSFYAFCIPAIIPLLIILFMFKDNVHIAIGIIIIIFLLFMYSANRTINLDILNFLLLKYNNIDLVKRLEEEIKERKEIENKLLQNNKRIGLIVDQRTDELKKINNKLLNEISERIEIEKSLRESEERFKTLHNASFGGIFIHDNGLVLDCNQGLSEITGYPVDELIGMDGFQLVTETSRSIVRGNIRSGYDKIYEVEGIRKNGDIYPLSLRGKNIPHKGRTIRVVEFRDITEQKNAEEERNQLQAQLLQSQKMEAIGTMAGGIAHDFNNILAGIIGYTEIVLRNLVKNNDLKNQQFLQNILTAGERAKALIEKILAFSRQAETERRPLSLQNTISDVLELIRVSLPSNIAIEKHFNSNATVFADPIQVHQVFMNLCANSGHAMKERGGTLTLSMDDVYLEPDATSPYPELSPGEFVKIEVTDNGKGIPPHLIDRIFDPFFTTKKKGEGTGMGLSMAHGIVNAMNGSITVESQENIGTRFTLYLPKISERVPQSSIKHKPIPVGHEHIVYVDDEGFLVDIGTEILRGLGYQVTGFTDSDEAWHYLQEHAAKVDLIISDMTMPKLTGVELAQKLMKLDKRPPVIICTGHNEELSKSDVSTIGIRDILFKPVSVDKLAVAVRGVLDSASSD